MLDVRPWQINPVLLLILVVLLLPGCERVSSRDGLSRAQQLEAERQYGAAIVELKSLLQQEPNNGEARLLLGKTYFDIEDYASARKELHRARSLGITDDVSVPLLARALIFQNEPDEVLMLETPGTLLPGPGAELNATKALAYLAVNQKEKTKIYIDKALQVMPDSNWVRFAHARILIEENSQTKAIPILEKLLQEDPSDGIAWSLLGNTYLTFGKLAEAENAYTQAIANRIKKSADYLRRGITRLKQGKLDTAAGDAEILLKLNPKWIEARYFAGKVKFRQRRFTEAERILEDTYYLNVNHFQVVFLLARTYLALNKLERAEALAENAYHLKPKLPVTRNLLVEIYLRQNKGEKSEELLRPILATYPGNLSTTMALASSLVQQYKNAEAEALLLHALQSDPSNLEARVALAHFYLSRNETKRVIDLLQGWDVKRAQKILERVIEKSPNSAKAHYGLAQINMILGNPREADNLFRKALELESQK